jgi:hypothetical protein
MILTPILKASQLALRRADEALPGQASEEAREKWRQKGDFIRCMSFAIASITKKLRVTVY